MLRKLYISNYAIIDEVEIEFTKGLNMMTGETGAGKSIILGALSLLLGERADAQAVKQGAVKCVVEAVFDNNTPETEAWLSDNDFDANTQEVLIRREVYSAGKSRAFINDTPATLQQLAELTDSLIDIHRQHQTLTLQQRFFQLFVVDAMAGNAERLENYRGRFHLWQKKSLELAELREQQQRFQAEQDFNQFQYDELLAANLTQNEEQESLEAELKMLENAGELQMRLNEVMQTLEQSDLNALMMIKSAQAQIQAVLKKMPQAESLANRLLELREQLLETCAEAESLLYKIENNPQRLNEIQERLNTIYHLQKKHRVNDVNGLLQIQSELEAKLNNVTQLGEQIEMLEKECTALHTQLIQQARELSEHRKKTIPAFEKQVKQLLKQVGMPNAEINVKLEVLPESELNSNGLDRIELLFSANKGLAPQPIQKMASGGELSRLMLCIKTLIAKKTALSTLVFDEIDNGISGETANQVGLLMKEISSSHQVICITHLPQIAAKADTHFFIYKEQQQEQTVTRIKKLTNEDRVIEIAKMLSGEKPGAAALQNAKELIDL